MGTAPAAAQHNDATRNARQQARLATICARTNLFEQAKSGKNGSTSQDQAPFRKSMQHELGTALS